MSIHLNRINLKGKDVTSKWHLIDADGQTLGRICSKIALLLQGKHKTTYVKYMNTGDYVVVINAKKIQTTGNKLEDKSYFRHSGYHGGLKETSLKDMLDTYPDRVIRNAVKGMLPKNIPGTKMLSRLKIYSDETHPHQAQINSKNS